MRGLHSVIGASKKSRDRYNKFKDGLISSSDQGNLAVFVGAGVSVLDGCLLWNELTERMLEFAIQEKMMNYGERYTLLRESGDNRNKKILEIIKRKFKKQESKFYDKLCNLIDGKSEGSSIYRDLRRIKATIFTTNADRRLNNLCLPGRIITGIDQSVSDLQIENLSGFDLIKIHGCITNPTSLVFTLSDYLVNYVPTAPLHDFLKRVFEHFDFLFIGVSLSEVEILQYIFQGRRNRHRKHFWLREYYRSQSEIQTYERNLFSALGIQIIPYYLDEYSYGGLTAIMADLATTFDTKTDRLEAALEVIDELP